MTGPAGFTVLHVFHGRLVRAALGLEQIGMAAVAAFKYLDMNRMRESNVARIFVLVEDVAGMALVAVAGNAERFLAVVTGAAGIARLHHFHADVVAVVLLFKYLRVTPAAVGAVHFMAEDNSTHGRGLYADLVD